MKACYKWRMDNRRYSTIFGQHSKFRRSGLGILPDQRSQLYADPVATPRHIPPLPAVALEALAYVQKAGFTDIVLTSRGPVIVGPAEIVYRYSPRAAIEGELNPYHGYLTKDQILDFWRPLYAILAPNLKIKRIKDLISDQISVIPDPGVPGSTFFSLAKMQIYGPGVGVTTPEKCAKIAQEQYSDVNGPVAIVTPAGERLFIMHSVGDSALDLISACKGLTWSSWAINQNSNHWPNFLVTFFLDVNIMKRNLGFAGRVPNRQKAVHFAAWDNWTLRIGEYELFEEVFKKGLTNGSDGSGFLIAEYLAVGLDTTMFEANPILTDLNLKGQVHPLHTWDQIDDAALNLSRVRRNEQVSSRYKGAKYEPDSYMEMKVIDFIPLSDIPMCVIDMTSVITGNSTNFYSEDQVKKILKDSGFRGDILVVSPGGSTEKRIEATNAVLQNYLKDRKNIIVMPPDKNSGIYVPTPVEPRITNFVQLPSGLIMSDVEVTNGLYHLITGRKKSILPYEVNKPIADISWFSAVAFCNAYTEYLNNKGYNLSYAYRISKQANGKPSVTWDKKATGFRLPTEEEWEYAAMGGGTDDPYDDIDDIAWYYDNSTGSSNPVGLLKPNNFGLYDMIGNVHEWTWTSGTQGNRVGRGGSFFDDASDVRAGRRGSYDPGYRADGIGFRICRNGPGYTPIGD